MRCQTQHDYGTRLLIEEKPQGKKSRMKVGKEPHAAREPRVGHPCYIKTMLVFLVFISTVFFAAIISQQIQSLQNIYNDDAVLDQRGAAKPSVVAVGESDTEEQGKE